MTHAERPPEPDDHAHGTSLGACMSRVYRAQVEAEPDSLSFRLSATDWPRSEPIFREALRRIGGPVSFRGHAPTGGGEGGSCIVASLDPKCGEVLFKPARPGQAAKLPSAHRFAPDGSCLAS